MRSTRDRRRLSVALLVVATGCHPREPEGALDPAGGDGGDPTSQAAVLVERAAPVAEKAPWQDAVREERWDDAARELAATPPGELAKPEVRYAAARVALARGDGHAALTWLSGLEVALPLLADAVLRARVDAELASGAFEEAGEALLQRGTPTAAVRACDAFVKAELPARARAACERALAMKRRTRDDEAAARGLRLRLPGAITQADDARWLAVHAPDLAAGSGAEDALLKADPKHPLTSEEWLARADTLADAGRTNEALRALDASTLAPGRKVPPLERQRTRGDILFRARDRYLEAARVLEKCAAGGGPHALEDAFRAARALARADHDDEAIVALNRILHGPKRAGPWIEEASHLVARLHLLHGRWKEAAAAFDEHAERFSRGAASGEASRDLSRERALAHLMNEDHAQARTLFEHLAEDEPDPLAAARARVMAALAAYRDGDRTHAVTRWVDVARSRPLSWPAMVARARLLEAGAPLPPAIDPAPEADLDSGVELPPLTLPPPVDALHRIGLDADAEAELHERENVITTAAPGRSTEALCEAYGMVRGARRRYQVAAQIPGALFAVAPTRRTRWAWDCAYPRPYEVELRARETAEALPPDLLYAVMRQESGFDPEALSPAHAVGLLQLLPETARRVALGFPAGSAADRLVHASDPLRLTSPLLNITLAARYLSGLLASFEGAAPLAVASYNAGPEAVERWLSRPRGLDLDLFVERIPFAETRGYVARVMGNFAHYGYLAGGEAAVPVVSLHALAAQ